MLQSGAAFGAARVGASRFTKSLLAAVALAATALSPARAQVSDDVVKLGVLTDMSSVYADGTGKGSLAAAQMAAEDFGGKVLGKPIVVVGADHQNKPDVGTAVARNWFDNDHVDAVVDLPTSSIAFAVQALAAEKNKVVLISGGGSSDLTGKACTANSVQWTYDTYALSKVAGRAMVQRGDDTWFFLTADYVFGQALERDATDIVKAAGGKVLGGVRHPLNTADFASFLVQAQASKAKVVALANAGGDASTAIKQAHEFGMSKDQKLLALLLGITDVHTLGVDVAQGLVLTEGWYWDLDDQSRAFGKRFNERVGHMPTMLQAGVYSAVTHYLKAIEAANTDEAKAVVRKMKELPVHDFFAKNGKVREDGRMVHDMYLMQIKTPAESKGPWDVYKVLATVPGDEAFRPLAEGGCPLVAKK